MKPKEGFTDKVLAGLETYLATLDVALIDSHQGTHADLKALVKRLKAAEAVIYSGLDSEDVKKAKLDAWRKTRGIGC